MEGFSGLPRDLDSIQGLQATAYLTQGLGREYALLLSRLGTSVLINSTTSSAAEAATTKEIADSGGKGIVHVRTVVDRNVVNATVKTAVDNFGHIDIIINNAGNAVGGDSDQSLNSDLWNILGVNVGGALDITQAAWPHMKSQKFGRVIMISSPMVFSAARQAAYGAAEMVVIGLARSIAIEGD